MNSPVFVPPVLERRSSLEYFYPGASSDARKSSLTAAIFTLVSTIIGGGVLSLPYAFAHTGIFLGLFYLIFIALASDFSIYILISCSRRAVGGVSYEEIAGIAYGRKMKFFTLFLLCALLYLAIIAYLILIRDLLAPLVEFSLSIVLSTIARHFLLWITIFLLFPLCLVESLNSLRFSSVVSVVSMLVLAGAISYRTVHRLMGESPEPLASSISGSSFSGTGNSPYPFHSIDYWHFSLSDSLYSFPIIVCSYLCQFNVLPLHAELIQPTRKRIKLFIHWVIFLVSIIYSLIGIMGYLYGLSATQGNILNNFSSNDPIITIGRICLLFTIVFSFPLLVLPMRNVLTRLMSELSDGLSFWLFEDGEAPENGEGRPLLGIFQHRGNSQALHHHDAGDDSEDEADVKILSHQQSFSYQSTNNPTESKSFILNSINSFSTSPVVNTSAATPPPPMQPSTGSPEIRASSAPAVVSTPIATTVNGGMRVELTPFQAPVAAPMGNSPPMPQSTVLQPAVPPHLVLSHFQTISETAAILFSATFLSMFVQNIATLWSLLGSSVSVMLAFILPPLFYLKIRANKPFNIRKLLATCLLIFGCLSLSLCSFEAIRSLLHPRVPAAH